MSEDETKKTSTPKKYLKIFLLTLLAVVIVCVFLIWRYLQKPSSGQIKKISSVSSVPVADSLERFEGKYFSFAHSSQYVLKSHKKDFEKNDAVLESALFSQSEVNPKKIAITVENMQGRTMSDTGNFIMRKKNPEIYKEEQFEINSIAGVSFSSVGSGFLEKVFFIPKEGYVVEIAFTAPITDDDELSLEMTNILKSIRWKSDLIQ